jgi:hypothetical protein
VVTYIGGRADASERAWCSWSRRGRRARHRHTRVPQERGRSCRLQGNSRVETPGDQLQARLRRHSAVAGAKPRVQPWYCQAKETKCGGKGGRKSQQLVVPLNRGNSIGKDPEEERSCRVVEPLAGNTTDSLRSARRVNVTPRDSPIRLPIHDLTSRMR